MTEHLRHLLSHLRECLGCSDCRRSLSLPELTLTTDKQSLNFVSAGVTRVKLNPAGLYQP